VSTMNGSAAGDIGGSKGAGRVFPHLDDLTSVQPNVDINWPIRKILQDAELLAKQADTHLDFRRPDLAVEEFMKAYIIATEYIPHHKDYPSLSGSQSELHRSYMGLLKRIKAQEPRFNEAKRLIKEDNEKSGVRARSIGKENSPAQTTNGATNGLQDDNHVNGISSTTAGSSNSASARKKPVVQPKPDALHGKALHPPSTPSSTSNQSDLASRFARLRTPVQDPRIRTQPISTPKHPEYTTKPSSASQPTTVRPLGPREMPSAPMVSPRQIMMPLDVQVPEMPKPPDAIYSPSRNPDTAATINFPTSIPRSSSYMGAGNHAAPPVSTVGRTPSFDATRQEYFSPAHKPNENAPHRQDPVLPESTTVSASELTEYLRMGSQNLRILLVDVRSREEFDDGHIMSQSIICIEPVTLRDGMSSEELLESLVLSPESELRLFERRNEFDLVVFYDQRSMSHKGDSHQASAASYLENFSKAMYEYGYEKQLKRRPRLLLGGLDAWADLMGPSSLQSSSTGSSVAKKSNGTAVKSARPLGRVAMAREPYRFPARKRTYESRPLTKEEETRWDETLREHPAHESATSVEQDSADELSYVRTTEDFFRRYPELPSMQESMISARPAPSIRRVDPYNAFPSPPARPAPALPRQKSSGVLEREPIAEYAMVSKSSTANSGPTPGLCGLRNNGVSCYIAAVVQCLSASGRLRDYLKGFNPGPNTRVPRKAGESTDPPQLLVRNFGNLLGHMWSGHYDFVVPNTFLVSVSHSTTRTHLLTYD
jgi:ubiquitin carboxyl-terminal hydrolase 8